MKTTIVLMILLMASSLHAQETSTWKALNAKVDTLYRQKRYDEAIPFAEEIVKIGCFNPPLTPPGRG